MVFIHVLEEKHCIFHKIKPDHDPLNKHIFVVCDVGGAVLLVEALLNEDGSGPLTAQLYSLNMLVQTEGRERTGAQYAALLAASGFTNIQHRLTGKIYDTVMGHKETWEIKKNDATICAVK